jgi:hypothetical protein
MKKVMVLETIGTSATSDERINEKAEKRMKEDKRETRESRFS